MGKLRGFMQPVRLFILTQRIEEITLIIAKYRRALKTHILLHCFYSFSIEWFHISHNIGFLLRGGSPKHSFNLPLLRPLHQNFRRHWPTSQKSCPPLQKCSWHIEKGLRKKKMSGVGWLTHWLSWPEGRSRVQRASQHFALTCRRVCSAF